MSNYYTIFVSSSDNYADIWDIFFDLYKKYWPDFEGDIVLNTEILDYHYEGLNIKCTKVGKLGSFGKVFRAGLNTIQSDNVLLMMIDYIFMGNVNHSKIEDYFQFFVKDNLDSLCFKYQGYPNILPTKHAELVYVLPPAQHIMFSYQIAFWKKKVLIDMALPHENPWMSEWYGSQRAEKMKIKLACPNQEISWPILYDLAGCLHQGKWLQNAVDFLNTIGYENIDYTKRGLYMGVYETLRFRFKLKYMIWSTGLKGSYFDLYRRKPLHF